MTSSSSLYGTVNTQSTNSGNSTSLYGEAGTPIPDAGGNVVVRGDLLVLSGNILTTAATGNIFPTNATTINLGNAATTVNIGAGTGTTTINNALVADSGDFGNITIGVTDSNTITTTSGDLAITAVGNNSVEITSGTNDPTRINRNTTTTNSVVRSLALNVQSTGTPAAGFGNSLEYEIETAVGNTERAGYVSVFSTDVTPGSEDFSMAFGLMTGGATADTKMFLDNTGKLTLDGGIALRGSTSGSSTFTAPATGSTLSYVLPGTAGAASTVLTNDGSGNLSWALPGGGGSTFGNITVAVVDDNTISTTTGNLDLTAAGNDGVEITSGSTEPTRITRNTTATNTSVRSLALNVQSAGTPAAGFGSSLEYEVETAVGNTERAGFVSVNSTDVTPGSEEFRMFFGLMTGGAAADTKMVLDGTGKLTLDGDLEVDGTGVTLAQGTTIGYSENNTRANRPQIQSTTGNSSGLRILAPNATTSAISNLTVFGSNDIDNGEFLSLQATGSTTTPFTIRTGKYTAGVFGASGEEINITDGGVAYASINPAGPTNSTDLTTKAYVDAIDTNTTYTVDASSTTGGANFNLVGSDATTDTIKFAGGTNVTVTATSANEITIASTDTNTTYDFNATSTTGGANLNLVGSDSTTDTVKLSNGTGVTVSQVSGSEVSVAIGQPVGTTADVTFNTVNANITDDNYVLGQLIATRNTAYVPPQSPLTTIAGQNGFVVSSSSGGLGYGANIAVRYHSGDTTAGTANAASATFSGASGTSSTPGGNSTNQVMGSIAWDGYTAGTSNNYASQIATANQGAGTTGLSPLQAQGYARQAFTNSTTVTTAVTGASGTGTVATLTFTTQNTAPYIIGQSITVAGMTPSGYNGTYVLTAVSTSSISYANTTTGFTSGGTIAAANTVTAAGMGFRVRGFANSTNMTVPNRFNFMDLTASAATFKSDAYTFANSVITGSTLTATNYMTLGATVGSVNQDTFTVKNTAGTTTYASFVAGGATITGNSLSQITRTTVGTPGSSEARPAFNIQLSRSDQAAPNNNDGTSFRYRVNGSNATNYTIADLGVNYSSTGDNQWTVNLANGNQTGATFSGLNTISSRISSTTIAAGTPSATPGASTVSTVATFQPTQTTLAASGTTYAQFAAGSAAITTSGRFTVTRTTPGTGLLLTQQTANANPADNDEMDFRLGIAGTSTSSNFARFDGTYKSSGDNEIGMSVSTDSFATDTDKIYIGSRASTKIRATPSGGGTASDILTVTNTTVTSARPFVFPSYTAAAANAITGAVGWQIAITDSASGSHPNGMMAFWDTTNARWSYIHDNSAV